MQILPSLTLPGLAPTSPAGFQVRQSEASLWEAIPRRGVPGRRPRNVKETGTTVQFQYLP
eukprot:1181279-Prorocentrum_minimum.AAC.4